MSEYREIITKAVIAKGRKFTQSTHTVSAPHCPTSILGCWIINHRYEAHKTDHCVEIHGNYDVNVWYSYSDNTKTEVVTETVSYKDVIHLKYREDELVSDEQEVIARVLQQPNCLECAIIEGEDKIVVQVEREFIVELIGETKVCIEIFPHACGDDEDCVDENELENLNPDFLEKQD